MKSHVHKFFLVVLDPHFARVSLLDGETRFYFFYLFLFFYFFEKNNLKKKRVLESLLIFVNFF